MPKQVMRLTAAVGNLPEELSSCAAFYFILNRPGKAVFEEMDTAVECGLLNEGPSLRILEQVRMQQQQQQQSMRTLCACRILHAGRCLLCILHA